MRGSGLPFRLVTEKSNAFFRVTGSTRAAVGQWASQLATKPGLTPGRPYSAPPRPLGHQLNYNYVRQPELQLRVAIHCQRSPPVQWPGASSQCRALSIKSTLREAPRSTAGERDRGPPEENLSDDEGRGFARSEKAARAAQVNLSARLNKDGLSQGNKPGVFEVWRLLRIARPEAKHLGGARSHKPRIWMERC